MQYGTFEIKINGNLQSVVVRKNITPAEAEILMQIHGETSVKPIEITEERNTSGDVEFERLMMRFRSKGGRNAMKVVYPGARPKIPTKFEDIGLSGIPVRSDKVTRIIAEKVGMDVTAAAKVVEATNKKVAQEEADAEAAVLKVKEDEADEDKPKKAKKKSAKKAKTPMADKVKIEYDD